MRQRFYQLLSVLLVVNLNLAAATELKVEARLAKLQCRPGEKQSIILKLSSALQSPCRLLVEEYWDLSQHKTVANENIETGKEWRYDFIPDKHRWGHEVRYVLTDAKGKTLAADKLYFAVGDNAYRTSTWSRTTFGNAIPRDGTREELAENLQNDCCSVLEIYSPWPGMWAQMKPNAETWVAGQGGYPESSSSIKQLISACHQRGIAVVAYYTPLAFGAAGRDWAREHPEWVAYNSSGYPVVFYNSQSIELARRGFTDSAWRDAAKVRDCFGAGCNLTVKECVRHGGSELLKAIAEFDLDGVRWDGHPHLANWTYKYLSHGAEVFDPEGKTFRQKIRQVDQYNAFLLTMFRNSAEKIKPGFLWGYNWSPDSTGDQGEKSWAVQKLDSMQLDESLVLTSESRTGKSHDPSWRWDSYQKRVKRSVNLLKDTSAIHMTVINLVDNEALNRYLATLLFASRSRLFGGWHAHPLPVSENKFAFRYSALLYSSGIENISAAKLPFSVSSSGSIWWQDFCYRQKLENGKVRYTAHLLSPLVKPYRDYSDQRTPEEIKDIVLKIRKNSFKRTGQISILDSDNGEEILELSAKEIKDSLKLKPLSHWKIVVAEQAE